ncbi:hypothetical protein Vretimale_2865 [Volvox reticuliferus]|uniref:Uncharacterized protein n=1 Tax=Volvox reticuliferus TaxID=1737510 RepID=A0A8J4FZN5_9CHLO|nr:hypothetical protein Vretimale_2865 [Volvox reticuliferus]
MGGSYKALRRMLYNLIVLAMLIAVAVESCPTPPVVLHSTLIAACSTEPARSAIGCSMYRFCGNETLQPAIFPQLCTTLKIAGSLCNDDANISSSLALCAQLRVQYTDDVQFRSCLPPYPISSTSAIKALHLHACEEMEGYPGDPMAGCDTCTNVFCPNPLASLSAGCIDMPMGQCDGLDALCTLGASVLCKKNLKDAPMRPPSPPPDQAPASAMVPPAVTSAYCMADSSLPQCTSYEYPLANITSDLSSLCASMAYMPGCTIWAACQAGGNVTGDFCRPMTLLSTICIDMPSMSGCKSYVALCKNTSAVQQCRSFPAIPGLPTTSQAKLAVVSGLCTANRTAMTPVLLNLTTSMCAACNQLSCRDYLTPLSSICSVSPGLNGCGTYYSWCQASAAWEVAAGSSISTYCKNQQPPPLPSSPRSPPAIAKVPSPPIKLPLQPPPKSSPPIALPPAKSSPPAASPPAKSSPPAASPPAKSSPPTASPPAKSSPPTASPPAKLSPPTASPPTKMSPPTATPPTKVSPPAMLPPAKKPPPALPLAKPPPQRLLRRLHHHH